MFNLIVGYTDGSAGAARMLEYTEDPVRQYIRPDGRIDVSRLVNLPTVVMPETGDGDSEQVARIGRLHHLTPSGGTFRYQFTPLRVVPSTLVVAKANELGIGDFQFTRHHWSVKDADLHGVLFDELSSTPTPKVFNLPSSPREQDLVAVMMPFGAGFTPVYNALKDAVTSLDLRCLRADDIWENDTVIDDVVSLLWRARVVISDLSGRNANVMYETGIAHTLGRDVIHITQSASDVPFDVQHIRYLSYLPNREGLEDLKARLVSRVSDLVNRPQ